MSGFNYAEARRTGRTITPAPLPPVQGWPALAVVALFSLAWCGWGWVVWTCTVGTIL